ncbi:MAG: energy transducer TonB [Pyrinomonadaceae bacterium]
MKTCSSCGEDFEDKFSFCPVDAAPLNTLAAALTNSPNPDVAAFTFRHAHLFSGLAQTSRSEYHPTILNSKGLFERLTAELQFTVTRLRTSWPELKRDPIGFGKLILTDSAAFFRERFAGQRLMSSLGAVFIVLTIVLVVTLVDRVEFKKNSIGSDSVLVEILTIPASGQVSMPLGVGVGAHRKGRVGFERDKGEGSKEVPKRAQGGGSGGDKNKIQAQQGKIPPPSEIPAPIPQLPPARKLALPFAGVDTDPVLWKDLSFSKYGDPRSKSTTPSNGSGDGGGMGSVQGLGTGDGRGNGFGSGSDGNIGDGSRQDGGGRRGGGSGNNPTDDPNRIFPQSLVEQRARVLSKPEPQYTDEARRNQISGTVVLRAVFSRTGEVTNIRAIQILPFGLTEKAIAAARQIRFLPAINDNRPVSVYMQLEYNFNLY